MDVAMWINVLLFPGSVIVAVAVLFLFHRRAEARWRAEARSHGAHTPAE